MSVISEAAKRLGSELEEKRGKLKSLLDAARNEAGEYDFTKTELQNLDGYHQFNDELDDLGKRYSDQLDLDKASDANDRELKWLKSSAGNLPPMGQGDSDADNQGRRLKTLGEMLIDSPSFKAWHEGGRLGDIRVELERGAKQLAGQEFKTTMTRGAGWGPESLRTGRLVLSAQAPIRVSDLIPIVETNMAAIKYMDETTFTNNAAERAENAAAGESALALTERSVTVESLATFLPVTDEQLADVAYVRDYIDQRMEFMVSSRLDGQLLNGNGTTPNILGVLNKASIQTQAKGADDIPTAIFNAISLVRHTGQAEPSGIVMHPNDHSLYATMKTADGMYITGGPASSEAYRMWGLPIAVTSKIADDTSLVGAFSTYSQLALRQGVTIEIGMQNDDFVKMKKTVRAVLRGAAIWYRAAAFCTVTGVD